MVDDKKKRGKRLEKTGVVLSDKKDKTRVVMVERLMQHPVYKKMMRKRRNFMVHDENNISKTGDIIKISQTRPISKRKRWVIVEIIKEIANSSKEKPGSV